MTEKPLVSIIIPTYNRAHLIGETLESVLAQTYQNWECIVVDDGSSDHTDEVLKTYCDKDARFQYHKRPETYHSGGNGARNYGFELSQGDFVQWFDDDDVMLTEFLKEKIKSLTENCFFIVCSGFYWIEKNKVQIPIDIYNSKDLFRDYCLWKIHILTPSVLFRKSFLENKKLFDLNIHRGQETELFSRLFFEVKDKDFIIINTPLFLYRQHQETKTYKNKLYVKEYKASLIYIYEHNLRRAFELKDSKLATFFYFAIIRIYFETFQHDDKNNRKTITKFLPKLLFINYKNFEVGLLILVMTFFNITSYKLYQYTSTRRINF